MEENKKTQPTIEMDFARDGIYLKEYGSKNFVAITEALDISRTKFECVPLHKGGKGGLKFYMSTRDTMDLCRDILGNEFTRRILLRKDSKYVDAYQYVAGENGSLRLNIGWSTLNDRDNDVKNNIIPIKYVTIQLQKSGKDGGKSSYLMSPVEMKALRDAARRYMMFTGLTPVTPGSYYESLVKAFNEGRADRAKRFGLRHDDDIQEYNRTVQDAEEAVEIEQKNAKTEKTPEPVTNANAKDDKKDAPVKTVDQKFKLLIRKNPKKSKGFFIYEAVNADNKEVVNLMFPIQELPNWYEDFAKTVAKNVADGKEADTKLVIIGEQRDNFILFKDAVPNE